MRLADQLVGRLLRESASTIDQLVATSLYSTGDAARISAVRVLLDKWLGVSRRFEQTKKLAELKALMDSWEQTADGGRRSGHQQAH